MSGEEAVNCSDEGIGFSQRVRRTESERSLDLHRGYLGSLPICAPGAGTGMDEEKAE